MGKKKNSNAPPTISPEEAAREFTVTSKQLSTLMQTRGHDGVKEMEEKFGGFNGLAEKLKTNLITGKSNGKH